MLCMNVIPIVKIQSKRIAFILNGIFAEFKVDLNIIQVSCLKESEGW